MIEDGSCSDGTLRPERGTFAWNIQESIQKEVFLMLEPKKKQEFARGSENRKYSRQEKKKIAYEKVQKRVHGMFEELKEIQYDPK